jgi:hypothetical protein
LGLFMFWAVGMRSPLVLQRVILFRWRLVKPLCFEDDWGRDLCFRPEAVRAALVDGRR